ncbi:MAG: GNAT family N-acetyltransferase [Lactobacillus sp.]|nr:GNAT family N-acetyltransferase [Lactobacillus sp.]
MRVYQTDRLLVRELTTADLPTLKQTLQDEKAMYAYAHSFSDEECSAWLATQLRRYQDDGFGLWALVRRSDGQFIGQCGLTMQTFAGAKVVEIGYLLQRAYWHQGYAIEAARGAKRYAFSQLECHEVWSIIRDNNFASVNHPRINSQACKCLSPRNL